MKVAVTSIGPTLDDQVEARFGRCPYFLIVDTDSMQFEAVANPNLTLGGGAGIQSAQMMAEKGVSHVLTGNCGPNAFRVFGEAGIAVLVGVTGPTRQAVERFKAGGFSSASAANVQSHFGMGASDPQGQASNVDLGGPPRGMPGMGMGRGAGMGGGRSMGRGKGMGFGMGWNPWVAPGGSGAISGAGESLHINQRVSTPLDKPSTKLNGQQHQAVANGGALHSGRKAAALVRPEKCAGCGICTDVCPTGSVRIEQQRAVVDPVLCTACATCVSECPNEAIIIVQQRVSS